MLTADAPTAIAPPPAPSPSAELLANRQPSTVSVPTSSTDIAPPDPAKAVLC